jgi:predicted RNA-binding protein with PIN domain
MATTYLIDGYNLLHAMGVLSGPVGPGGLEKARLRLLGLLHGTFAERAPSVTVVFDASKALPGAPPEMFYRGLHVLFAVGKKEADDVIEHLVREASAPKSVHVVSDDHRIQQAARRRRAVVLTCEEFLQWVDRQRQHQSPATPAPEKKEKLSPEEMQRWLEEFGDVESDPSLRQAFEKFDFEDYEPEPGA